jgi:hypothetical protein
MNFIINTFFLLSIIALGELAYADNKMELTSIVDLLDSSKDVELIRFSCYKKSNQENVCWLLVKVAEIGMLFNYCRLLMVARSIVLLICFRKNISK